MRTRSYKVNTLNARMSSLMTYHPQPIAPSNINQYAERNNSEGIS